VASVPAPKTTVIAYWSSGIAVESTTVLDTAEEPAYFAEYPPIERLDTFPESIEYAIHIPVPPYWIELATVAGLLMSLDVTTLARTLEPNVDPV
jgi:hypothetical protein